MPAPRGRHPRNCLIHDQSQSLGLGRRTSRCARDGDVIGAGWRTSSGRRRGRTAPTTTAGGHEDEARNQHADQQDSDQHLPARAKARSEQRHSTDREQQGIEESRRPRRICRRVRCGADSQGGTAVSHRAERTGWCGGPSSGNRAAAEGHATSETIHRGDGNG